MTAHYTGQSAHAAACPWKGRNALDAAVLGYVNVAALRQHISPTERVHGIFHAPATAPNIVPRRRDGSGSYELADLDGRRRVERRRSAPA